MDKENFFTDDVSPKKAAPKIDDFTRNFKENTMDFLSHERDEKIDAEKPKADVDDFLNFHDDFQDVKPQAKANPVPSYEAPKEPEPEIDFNAIDDEFLKPYAASDLKGSSEKDKFISSEDLLTDFRVAAEAADETAVEAPKVIETPKIVEVPKPVSAPEKPLVVEPVKPVVEPIKPKSAPPPAPIKKPTSDDTQIEAEKIFKSIGLG